MMPIPLDRDVDELIPADRDVDGEVFADCDIFSKKSNANIDSISCRQLFTSLSISENWYGGQVIDKVEKKPYRSFRLCID